jgi:hypothetical protein
MMEGKPIVPSPMFDILLSDVKNERGEGETGVVTLGEIAGDLGFENRATVSDEEAAEIAKGSLTGIIRGKYSRTFVPCVIKFRNRQI